MKVMIRWVTVFLAAVVLNACSAVEGVTDTLNYAQETTRYLQEAQQFTKELPQLAEQAIGNPELVGQLQAELEAMRDRILSFEALEPPAFAQELHRQLEERSVQARDEIEMYLEQLQTNGIDFSSIANSEMLDTLTSVISLLQQIEQLVQ